MLKQEAAALLAGIGNNTSSSAPTNLHVISGEVVEASSDGTAKIAIEGIAFSEDDTQYITVNTLGGLEVGDVATIILSGESGHAMKPLAIGSIGGVDRIVNNVEVISSDYEKASTLQSDVADLGFLYADSAVIVDLVAKTAVIERLDVDELTAAAAYVEELTVGNVSADSIIAEHARISALEAETAKIQNLSAEQLEAVDAYIEHLTANDVTAETLVANSAVIDNLSSTYAQIDGANINNATIRDAWIDNLMVQSGLIAHEGVVYSLDAIQVNASSITAGTIDVSRLIVTVDGEKYMVHFDAAGGASYEKLDGGIIEDYTITADKIVAGAVTAEKITTENIVGSGGWINLRNGTFAYVNAVTGEGIVWDGEHLYISGDVTIGEDIISKISDEISDVVYDITYTEANSVYTLTAHVYKAGVEITSELDPDLFVWYLRTETGDSLLGTGVSVTVAESAAGYRASVIGGIEESIEASLVTSDDDSVVDSDGDTIDVYAVWSL